MPFKRQVQGLLVSFDSPLDVMMQVLRLAREERNRVVSIVSLGLVSAIIEGFGLSLIILIAQISLASGETPDLPYIGSFIEPFLGMTGPPYLLWPLPSPSS